MQAGSQQTPSGRVTNCGREGSVVVMLSLARGNSKGVPWFRLGLKRLADPLSVLTT
jgi:hypothetical protein